MFKISGVDQNKKFGDGLLELKSNHMWLFKTSLLMKKKNHHKEKKVLTGKEEACNSSMIFIIFF